MRKANVLGKIGLAKFGNILGLCILSIIALWNLELIGVDVSKQVNYEISSESIGLNTQEEFASALSGYKLDDAALTRAVAGTGIGLAEFKDSVTMEFAFVNHNGAFEGLTVEFSSTLTAGEVQPAYDFIFEDIKQYLLAKQDADNHNI